MNRKNDIIAASFIGAFLIIIIALIIITIIKMVHGFALHDFLILVSLIVNGGLMSYFFISLIHDINHYSFYIKPRNSNDKTFYSKKD